MSTMMLYLLLWLVTAKSQRFNKPDGSAIQFLKETEEKWQLKRVAEEKAVEKVFEEPQKWSCPIPFVFDESLAVAVPEQEVQEAMNYIQKMTGWTFVVRTNEDDYIVFQNKTGPNVPACSSQTLGKLDGSQWINLDSGCSVRGIIVHEIMHAIGAAHEHQRTDSYQFINVDKTNIQSGSETQFEPKENSNPGPYDYDSIMHYNKWAFAEDISKMTITPIGDISDTCYIGQRFELTQLDIEHLNSLIDGPHCSTLSPDVCVPTNIVICGANSKINGFGLVFQEYELFGTLGGSNRYRSKTTYLGYHFTISWFNGWHVAWEKNWRDYLITTDANLFTASWSQYNYATGEYEVDPFVSVSKVDCGDSRDCYVNIKSAKDLKSSDDYSYSDPYVIMYGKYKDYSRYYYLYKTTTKWNNEQNPIWNEEYYLSPAAYDYLYFQVYDYDLTTPHDYMADTKLEDVNLNTLKCNRNNLMTLQLDSDYDGDKGTLKVNVFCRCY